MTGLGRRASRLTLCLALRGRLSRLRDARFVGLRSLALQDGGLLRRLRMDRLSRKLSTNLLLSLGLLRLLMLLMLELLLLVLLGPLQDLRRELTLWTRRA